MAARVLMLAVENGALAGAKVGGMADVIRDLPGALLTQNVYADVMMPGYGHLVNQTEATFIALLQVPFADGEEIVSLYQCAHPLHPECRIYLLENWRWNDPEKRIYADGGDRPFAQDATKFALFCAAAAQVVSEQLIDSPQVIHLHDWHTGFFAMLRKFDPRFRRLLDIPLVFSIHNLALQGIRPFSGDESSLAAWFPQLTRQLSGEQWQSIWDPRYPHCINPMRAGIVLSDKVHLVSPTYAKEVLKPSHPAEGFFGGEGLEADLQQKAQKRRLFGILNGCDYDHPLPASDASLCAFLQLAHTALISWQAYKPYVTTQDYIATQRLQQWQQQAYKPALLLTSVGRLTDQKMLLLHQRLASGQLVVEAILTQLKAVDGCLILLGSGDPHLAEIFRSVAARFDNLLFLNGYAEDLSAWLYRHGDLFLMPSSFEPCGISQMLAMREGQPCLVHAVGGLKDTVEHEKSGFVFSGDDLPEQAQNLLCVLQQALDCYGSAQWTQIKRSAKARRFSWKRSAAAYVSKLYRLA